MTSLRNRGRLARHAAIASLFVASVGMALVAPAQAQTAQPPAPTDDAATDDAPTSEAPRPTTDELVPGLPVPDDVDTVVHSWAIAPGDGTVAAGERPNLTYEVSPGGRVEDVVTLFNFSNVQLTFAVYATDGFNNDDGSFNLLPAEEPPTDVGTWVTVAVDSVTLEAGQQAVLPITIDVPVDASPGDHVGAVLATSRAFGTGPDNATVTLDRRTGTRLNVRVAGQLRSELTVEDLDVSYDAAPDPRAGAAEVTFAIVNRGNVRMAGRETVSVAGPFGLFRKSLDPVDIPELLPGERIVVTRQLDDVTATGLLFAKVELELRSPVGGGDDLAPHSSSGSTTAIPYAVVAALLILIFGGLARRAYRRHQRDATDVLSPDEVLIVPVDVIDVDADRQPTGR